VYKKSTFYQYRIEVEVTTYNVETKEVTE